MVRYGMSHIAALKAATSVDAQLLGIARSAGAASRPARSPT
jgi:imidazolonepropionase-like amidohydrolase